MCSRSRCTLAAVLLAATLAASGCAADATTTGSTAAQPTSPPATVVTTAQTRPAKRPPHHRGRPRRRHPAPPTNPRSGSLAYSTASNDVVQSQPAPGSCHAIGTGLYSRPDPTCTPGALNPAVTQATIDRTICVEGWTATVRPPESITEQEKAASMAAYGDTGSLGDYEYDHFVPLELGGATNDPRNLWPEPGASPNPKDTVEDELRQQVCDGQITLAQAQHEIVTNWVRLAQPSSPRAERSGRPVGAGPGRRVHALGASYSSRYNDYDVYVHSNQPDQTVTVTDAYGHSDTWHTDAPGTPTSTSSQAGTRRGGGSPHESARPAARPRSERAYLLGDRRASGPDLVADSGLRSAAARFCSWASASSPARTTSSVSGSPSARGATCSTPTATTPTGRTRGSTERAASRSSLASAAGRPDGRADQGVLARPEGARPVGGRPTSATGCAACAASTATRRRSGSPTDWPPPAGYDCSQCGRDGSATT